MGTFTYYVSSRGGRGGKPLLTYHCSNKTKTIEIADIGGGEGGQKLENLADIICERSLKDNPPSDLAITNKPITKDFQIANH